jgi:hypothetical protein
MLHGITGQKTVIFTIFCSYDGTWHHKPEDINIHYSLATKLHSVTGLKRQALPSSLATWLHAITS